MPGENRLLEQFYISWIIPKSGGENPPQTRRFLFVAHFVVATFFGRFHLLLYVASDKSPKCVHDTTHATRGKPRPKGAKCDIAQKEHWQEHRRREQSCSRIIVQIAIGQQPDSSQKG